MVSSCFLNWALLIYYLFICNGQLFSFTNLIKLYFNKNKFMNIGISCPHCDNDESIRTKHIKQLTFLLKYICL